MAKRIPDDAYITPDELALAICGRMKALAPVRILEPAAGDGAFIRAARAVWSESSIAALDIRESCREACEAAGAAFTALDFASATGLIHGADLIIGNPPFTSAEAFVRQALSKMHDGAWLAFILRVGFYGAPRHEDFWPRYPERYFAPIAPRPSFTSNGKVDSQEYALFIWQKLADGVQQPKPERLKHVVWKKPLRERKPRSPRVLEQAKGEAPELE